MQQRQRQAMPASLDLARHFNLMQQTHFRNFSTQKDGEKAGAESVEKDAAEKQKKGETSKRAEDSTTSSSDEEGASAEHLTKEDVKQIKSLIKEQEAEIEKLKEQVKALKEKYIYQIAENDNTIKRYKKEIEQTSDFAITKFAKELLDVRDNLQRATDHFKTLKMEETTDLEEIKKKFADVQQGMNLTSSVMDSTLRKFKVLQFDPKGEKFDPNVHEAIFTIPDPTKEPNTVGEVMQTGWKIGERVLRAAKVGIFRK